MNDGVMRATGLVLGTLAGATPAGVPAGMATASKKV